VCWCGEPSETRGRVCRLQFLLVLTSAVLLRSESRGTHDHILLSQIRGFPFRRLLRLVGSRWKFSTPPPHGVRLFLTELVLITTCKNRREKTVSNNTSIVVAVFTDPLPSNCSDIVSAGMCLPSNGDLLWLNYFGLQASCHNINFKVTVAYSWDPAFDAWSEG
jgi:hypothetical protein